MKSDAARQAMAHFSRQFSNRKNRCMDNCQFAGITPAAHILTKFINISFILCWLIEAECNVIYCWMPPFLSLIAITNWPQFNGWSMSFIGNDVIFWASSITPSAATPFLATNVLYILYIYITHWHRRYSFLVMGMKRSFNIHQHKMEENCIFAQWKKKEGIMSENPTLTSAIIINV